MPHKQNPMPLENLPGYLRSNKDENAGSSPVVSMGQIIVPKSPWPKRVAFAMLMCMVLGTGGIVTYDAMSTNQLTVIVNLDSGVDPSLAMSKIAFDSGGQITSFKQNEDSTYEVKVKTRKSRRSFLEWLRDKKGVEKAELSTPLDP